MQKEIAQHQSAERSVKGPEGPSFGCGAKA